MVQVMTAAIAVGASATTGIDLGGGEFTRFAIQFPTTNPLTGAADISAQGSYALAGTYATIGYSNSPATATSTFVPWGAPQTSWGSMVICEAALFTRFFKLKFSTAATAAGEVYIHLGKD
jgi:hypothetical protein